MSVQWSFQFGTDTGSFFNKKGLSLTSDGLSLLYALSSQNTDYNFGTYFEILIVNIESGSGTITWGANYGVSGVNTEY